jgi:hypothetical protein
MMLRGRRAGQKREGARRREREGHGRNLIRFAAENAYLVLRDGERWRGLSPSMRLDPRIDAAEAAGAGQFAVHRSTLRLDRTGPIDTCVKKGRVIRLGTLHYLDPMRMVYYERPA